MAMVVSWPYTASFDYLLRTSKRVEEVGVELKTTTNRARSVPKAVCLVADPGRKQAAGEVFDTLPTSTHSGECLRRGLSSLQQHQRPPGEEVGGVTVGVLVSNTVEGHARVC
jgi:hypothetical protein